MFYKLIEKKVENMPRRGKKNPNKNAAAHGGVSVVHVQWGRAHKYFLYENLLLAHFEHASHRKFGGKVNSPVLCIMF